MQKVHEEKLERLNEDELLIEAIALVFSQRIELERPDITPGDDDEVIGQKYRAFDKAKEILNKAMLQLKSYKVDRNKPNNFNKAR